MENGLLLVGSNQLGISMKIQNDPAITAELVRYRFEYNPDTGELTYRHNLSARARKGNIAGKGYSYQPYKYVGIGRKIYAVHRIIWLYVHGEWPEHEIDHINGDGHDNRLCNLRQALPCQNQYNQKIPKNNTSGVKGLHWLKKKNKWRACVAATAQNGFNGYLGIYENREDAIAAIKKGRRLLHGEFHNDG